MRQRLAVPDNSWLWVIVLVTFIAAGSSCASSRTGLLGNRDEWQAAQVPKYIGEYDDEQAFWDGSDYGPVAHIWANPYAHHYYSTPAAIANVVGGVLVAIVDVDQTARQLSRPYTRLGLQAGRNCVWLTGQINQWRGLVTKAMPADSSCPRGQAPTATLRVAESGVANESFAVARFTEDVSGSPLIGVKCHNKWCDLHLEDAAPAEPHQGNLPHDHPGWRNKSRHDEEMLTVYDSVTKRLRPVVRGSVVPHDDLGRKTFDDFERSPVHVGSVWLANDPPAGTKYADTQFKKGENEIWVWMTASGKWYAQMRRKDLATPVNLKITWRAHDPGHKPLPRGRWYWRPDDQDVWYQCDAGCCDITFALQQ